MENIKLNEENKEAFDEIRREYLKSVEGIKKEVEGEYIYDDFYGSIPEVNTNNRTKSKTDDDTTYKLLKEVKQNDFWSKVSNAIASVKKIDISEVSDELDEETKELLK